ncbi:MAG: MFS transporter [Candidatus Eremiobacteraeota bacterium]|nr:MFS transporter [Candidatus Eremiobacteraeota bacterium]
MALSDGTGSDEELVPPAPNRRLGALSYSEFRLLWFGLIVSNTGSWMAALAQGWLVVELSPSQALAPFYLGLVGFVRSIPVVLLSGFAGTIADRVDRRRILVIAQIILGLCGLSLAILSQFHLVRIWHVLVLAALSSATSSFEAPTRQSMVPLLVGPRDLMNAIGLNSAAFNGPAIFGPAIGGILVGTVGVAMCFYINALSYVAVLIALAYMTPKPPMSIPQRPGIWQEMMEGLRFVRTHADIFAICMLAAIVAVIARPYIQLLPAFVKTVMHGGPKVLGAAMAASGAGALAGSIATAMIDMQRKRGLLLAASGIATGLSLTLFALSHEIVLALASLVALGISIMLFMGMTNTLLQVYTPIEIRGRVMSLYTMIFLGFMPFGSWLLGSAASLTSLPATLAVAGLVVAIAGLVVRSRNTLPELA